MIFHLMGIYSHNFHTILDVIQFTGIRYALFSYAEESEIKCLKCINELLDEFIENNLHLWFDENYVANLKKKAKEIM